MAVSQVEMMLEQCKISLEGLEHRSPAVGTDAPHTSPYSERDASIETASFSTGGADQSFPSSVSLKQEYDFKRQLVAAYSTHILHVLHVLLHGKWDPICMLEDDEDWITSPSFLKCSSHAVASCQAVSKVLEFDPELTFMPYLFGIYLLHGSFVLLLYADRMSLLGANKSVEDACETIIRAHEVCLVTLNTEYQVRHPVSAPDSCLTDG